MVATTVLAAVTLATAATAAPLAARQYEQKYESSYQPTYNTGTQYENGFPVCQKNVEKPAYDNKGHGYGWENGKSCIVPKNNNYRAPSYQTPTYKTPSYEKPAYQAPSYQTPSYQTPTYHAPSYQTPAYQTPSYQAPPTYRQYFAPMMNNHQAPAYQAPAYQPAYQTPNYQAPAYQTPSYEPTYQQPSNYQPAPYTPPYGKKDDCDAAKAYYASLNSKTLKQCVEIACAYGQTPEYKNRALYQCHALEEQAKATNGGKLPYGW
ncbi:hypothetical protein HK104_006972 [Borealophlyctis nickersoniae]|nr:hypothetical protein HK104_006972 [Borealophlyctis nickersoniae]